MRRGNKPVRRRWDDALSRLQWWELEQLLVKHYREQGYEVQHTGTANTRRRTDGGIDLKLRRGTEYLVLECKHWNTLQVPHNEVHELLGIMHTQRATGAIFVTSGEFSDAALRHMASIPNFLMVDGVGLRAMLDDVLPIVPTGSLGQSAVSAVRSSPLARRALHERSEGKVLLLKFIVGLALLWYLQSSMEKIFPKTGAPATSGKEASISVRRVLPATQEPFDSGVNPPRTPGDVDVPDTQARDQFDLRQWEKRNAESMEILEATTPEM